jgi:recombination protein RecR
MAKHLPKSVRKVIEQFAKLPGIGPKSAQRLAIYLLRSPENKLKELGQSILDLKKDVVFCNECWNIAEENPCTLCVDESRNKNLMCVVEDVLDVVAIEKTKKFNGVYHVLHGVLSPINGVGPEQLKMFQLFKRIENRLNELAADENLEIIIATNPSLEGEATALYIQKELLTSQAKVTRIARGLPVGGDLEYADEVTVSRALMGRSSF